MVADEPKPPPDDEPNALLPPPEGAPNGLALLIADEDPNALLPPPEGAPNGLALLIAAFPPNAPPDDDPNGVLPTGMDGCDSSAMLSKPPEAESEVDPKPPDT